MSNRSRERQVGRLRASGVLRAVFETLDRRWLLSVGPGNPDFTFSSDGVRTDGRVEVTVSGPIGALRDAVLRSDGAQFVLTDAAGPIDAGSAGLGLPNGLRVARLLSDSSLDPGFADGGVFSFNLGVGVAGAQLIDLGVGNGVFIAATAYDRVPDGSGTRDVGDFLLIKIDDFGNLDTSFGGTGFRTYDLDTAAGHDILLSAALDSSNRILLSGTTATAPSGPARHAFLRLDLAGNPDTAFGPTASRLPSGAFTETISGEPVLSKQSSFVNPDGSFYVLSTLSAASGYAVKRFDADGLPEPNFSASLAGTGRTALGLIASGSNLYVVGSNAGGLEVASLLASNGVIDTSFAIGGVFSYTLEFDSSLNATAAAISFRGASALTVAVIGVDGSSSEARVFGLTLGGNVDPDFTSGEPQLFASAPAGQIQGVPSVFSTASATLVGAAVTEPLDPFVPTDTALGASLTRLTSTGALDLTFNSSGTRVLGNVTGGLPASVSAAHVDANGRLFTAFTAAGPNGGNRLGIAIYDRRGNFVLQTETGIGSFRQLDRIAGVVEQTGNRYLVFFSAVWSVAGLNNRVLVVGRISAATGLPDGNFGNGGFSFAAPLGDVDYVANAVYSDDFGRIYVAGGLGNGHRAVFAFDSEGNLDTSFASGGVLQFANAGSASYEAIFEDPSAGKVIAVATRIDEDDGRVLIDRFDADGNPDNAWGTSGTVLLPLPGNAVGMSGLAGIVADGTGVHIGGSAIFSDGRRPVVARLNALTGALDTAFADSGFRYLDTPGAFGEITGITFDRTPSPLASEDLIVVGSTRTGKPLLARISPATGAVDTNYAAGFQPPARQTGRFRGVILDPASRPIAFGDTTNLAKNPQTGLIQRFGALLPAAPTVIEVRTLPRPRVGDAFGRVSLTFSAPPGLRIDTSTLSQGLGYVAPDTPNFQFQTAELESFVELDFSTVRATYRYTPFAGGPFTTASAGNYAFFTQLEVIRDDGGNALSPQSVFNVLLDFSGLPGPGDRDNSYNNTQGQITSGDVGSPGLPVDIVPLPSGGSLVLSNLFAGTQLPFSGPFGGVAVSRFTATGELDTSFGTLGRAFFNYRSGTKAVALVPNLDGSFYIVGNAYDGNTLTADFDGVAASDIFVARFTEDGQLDSSFGGSGFRVFDVSGSDAFDFLAGAARLSTGGLVLYGQTNRPSQNGVFINASGFFILKLTDSGETDLGYGDPGFRIDSGALFFDGQTFDFVVDEAQRTAAVDPSDNLYIAGRTAFSAITSILALSSDGLPLFAPNYLTTVNDLLPVQDTRILYDPAGSLLLAQLTFSSDLIVTRLGLNLIADNTFGTASGRFSFNVDSGLPSRVFRSVDIALDTDRTLYIAAAYREDDNPTDNHTNAFAFSLTPAGALNTAFNGGAVTFDTGRNTTTLALSAANGPQLAIGRDLGAPSFPDSPAVLVRYTPAGTFDTTFNNATLGPGRVIPPDAAGAAPSSTQALHLNPATGQVFAVTASQVHPFRWTLTFRLIDPSGTAASEGTLFVPRYSDYDLLGVFPLPDGGWILACTVIDAEAMDARRTVLARFRPDGTLDSSFGSGGLVEPSLPNNPLQVHMRAATLSADGIRLLLAGAIDNTPAFFTTDLGGNVVAGPIFNNLYSGYYSAVTPDPVTGGYFIGLTYVPANSKNGDTNRGDNVVSAIIERRQPDLSLSPDFGTGILFTATATAGFTSPLALAVDSANDRLLVGGRFGAVEAEAGGSFFRVYSITAVAPEPNFADTLLLARTTLGGIRAIAIDTDGRYLLAGSVDGLPRLLKVLQFGGIDQDYGQNSLPPDSVLGSYVGLTLDPQGRPIAWGFSVQNTANPQPGIVHRFFPASINSPPTATFVAVNPVNLPFSPSGSYLVTLTYTASLGRTIDLASISAQNLRLFLNGVEGGTFAVASVSNPQPNVAEVVYSFTTPINGFDFSTQGLFEFVLSSTSPVRDNAGRAVAPGTVGSFTLNFPRPTAVAVAPQTPAPGATAVTFTLTLTPAPGRTIDPASLGNTSIRVTRPDGSTAFATLLSTAPGPGSTLLATFSFTSASGVFDAAAAGTYALALLEGGATDDRAVPVAFTNLFSLTFAAAGQPGQLNSVAIPQGPYLPGSALTPTVTLTNPLPDQPAQPITLRFFLVGTSGPILLGDIPVAALAPGQTLTLTLGSRLALPNAASLPPGSYLFGARTLAPDGTLGTEVLAQTPISVIAPPAPRPGTLDPNFGGGSGIVTSFVPGPRITLVGSVAQPGSILISGGYNADGDFVLLRFLADGTRDLTFGNNGQITLDVSGGFDLATTLTSDPQGRILLGGTSILGDTTVFSLVRFNPDGTLDTSFANSGILLYTPPGSQAAFLRGVQTDRFGRPYLLGSVNAPQTPGGPVLPQGVVIRLTPVGTVDTTFGSLGVVSAAFTSNRPGTLPFADGQSELTSLLLLPNRIVLGGHSANAQGTASRFLLAALLYDGRLDPRFGNNGVLDTQLGSTQDRITVLAQAPNGAIYAAGSRGSAAGSTALILRTTPNGRIDRAFNRGQPRLLANLAPFSTVSSVSLSVNNSVLITVATANSPADAAAGFIGTVAFRLTPTGAADPTFNGGNPLLIFGQLSPLTTFNTPAFTGDFDAFVQSKQGATQRVEGGRIRALAATPVTDGTAIAIAQLSPDGADLLIALTASLPDTVRPGTRATATLTLSNIGSLAANGRFSVSLVANPSDGDTINLLLRNLSGRLLPGSSRNLRVQFTLPRNTPNGTYTLQSSVSPLSFADINPANNTTLLPGQLNVASIASASSAPTRPLPLRASATQNPDDERSATLGLFSDQPLKA